MPDNTDETKQNTPAEALRRATEMAQEPLFAAAISASSGQNFLGGTQTVELVLRDVISKVMDQLDQPEAKVASGLMKLAKRTARIFLGKDARYTVLPGWNRPGRIDEFLAQELNIDETDPLARVTTAMLLIFEEIMGVVEDYTPDVLDEQIDAQLTGILEWWTHIFLGQSQVSQQSVMYDEMGSSPRITDPDWD